MSLKNAIVEIKEKLNIVDEFEKKGLKLIPAGMSRYKCSCPFHKEKTPSMIIYENTQTYHCFGCGEGGDVITFKEKTDLLSFREAVLSLAEENGISIEEDKDSKDTRKHLSLLKKVDEIFKEGYNNLPENHEARKNIRSRGLSDKLDYFGWVEDGNNILNFLKSKGYTDEDFKAVGLLTKKGNFFFYNRLIFTIYNYVGQPIAFSARAIFPTKAGKYINSPVSEYFDKSSAFFNIDKAKKHIKKENKVYVVEGQFDVVAMTENGYENTVATSGTAMTKKHMQVLNTLLDNGEIILLMDGDSAGMKAMYKIFENYPEMHTSIKVIILDNKEDPCDYFQHSKELPKPISILEWVYNGFKSRCRGNSIEDIQRLSLIAYKNFSDLIKDPVLRNEYELKIQSWAGVDPIKTESKKEKNSNPSNNAVKEAMLLLAFYSDLLKDCYDLEVYPDEVKPLVNAIVKKTPKENFDGKERKVLDYVYNNPPMIEDEEQIVSQYKYLVKNFKR